MDNNFKSGPPKKKGSGAMIAAVVVVGLFVITNTEKALSFAGFVIVVAAVSALIIMAGKYFKNPAEFKASFRKTTDRISHGKEEVPEQPEETGTQDDLGQS